MDSLIKYLLVTGHYIYSTYIAKKLDGAGRKKLGKQVSDFPCGGLHINCAHSKSQWTHSLEKEWTVGQKDCLSKFYVPLG